MSKKYKLDADEQVLLDELERGEWQAIPDQEKEMAKLQRIARNYGNKVHRVNIRLTDWDYEKARVKALEQGVPFTTLIGSIVHQFLSGEYHN